MRNLATRLAEMPADQRRATLGSLPTHLAKAARAEKLHFLLTNFDFMEAKIFYLAPEQLIKDYDIALYKNLSLPESQVESLKLIQSAIRLSAHVLEKYKSQLSGQLLGRLLTFPQPDIQSMLKQAKSQDTTSWLRPLTPSLTPPGGSLVRTLSGHQDEIWAIAVTPDGRHALCGSSDGTVKLWDLGSGIELLTLTSHQGWVNTIAVTPDGQYAVFGSRGSTLELWDLRRGTELVTLNGHSKQVNAVAVIPDWKRAISGSADGTLKL
ncbi:MAG: WD40 repeat domain-containing protein [Moorea sp. SIO4G2]|nr:WD40 repeat domain-containing protein [Moorena sp. SIO4G2]